MHDQTKEQKHAARNESEQDAAPQIAKSFSPPAFVPTAGPVVSQMKPKEDTEPETLPWNVNSEGGVVTFKLGSGEAEKSETHTVATVRAYIVKNYNWNGIVQLMKGVATQDSGFSYTVPTNLKGTTADDSLIIPDSAIEAIIRLQAKYQIETKYATNASSKIKEILKGVDGQPGKGFASNILGTTYTDLVKESDN